MGDGAAVFLDAVGGERRLCPSSDSSWTEAIVLSLFFPFCGVACFLPFDWRGAAIDSAVFARPLLVFAEGGVGGFFPEMGEVGGVADFDVFGPVGDFPRTSRPPRCERLEGGCSGGTFFSFGIIYCEGAVRLGVVQVNWGR